MSVPDHGLPVNLSPLVLTLLGELGAQTAPRSLVPLRRKTCGCLLGSTYRLPSGDLILGQRRIIIDTVQTGSARKQRVALAMAEITVDFATAELSCKHSRQVTLPVSDVRDAIEDAAQGRRRPGASYTL